jgi:osmoprotectant transport system permease protein
MTWIMSNWEQIASYAAQHALLSILPILVATLIAVPIGRVCNSRGLSLTFLHGTANVLYAIPSLPLFIVLPSLLGTKILDPINVEVALTMYAVALLLTSSSDGFSSIDPKVLLSADAMGYSPWKRFMSVEMPLAGPVLMEGIRVASVSTVSLVTVGSLIGVNSLGYFFVDGYQRNFALEIWVGIIGTALIALLFDSVIILAGKLLMPWTRLRDISKGGRA